MANKTHLDIAQCRLHSIKNLIRPKFDNKVKELIESARKDSMKAHDMLSTPYGREVWLDCAKDMLTDSMFEEKAVDIIEEVSNAIGKRIDMIEAFVTKYKEKQDVVKTICINCSNADDQARHIKCDSCGRVICNNGKSGAERVFRCDKCKKAICSLCLLFKYLGKVRCVECYEDILDYPEDWIPDEWLYEDDEDYY